jgi:hypothetical protein
MGVSTNAMLVYGYDLGSDEGWKVRETDEDGYTLTVDWYDEDHEDEFVEQAGNRLLADAGFTETDWRSDGYFDRKAEAERAIGVEFESHCSGDCPMWILAAHTVTAHRGGVKQIDLTALALDPGRGDWDAKLRHALTVLGLTPTQEQAAWFLCSYWG